jgi:hypothetical protein
MNSCASQQDFIFKFTMPSPNSTLHSQHHHSSTPAYYNNAKFEEISYHAIKPPYNGSEDQLIPFLTKFDIRHQDEGWSPATYTIEEKRINLTCNFALVTEITITNIAEKCWNSPDVNQAKHTFSHETYNAHLLAVVLMNSITDEFKTTIINSVPHL